MNALLSNPMTGILITLCAYITAKWIRSKVDSPLAHPLLLATLMVILVLNITPITIEQYYMGGNVIMLFILPATVAFSYQIYRQRKFFTQNVLPVVVGCSVGSIVSAFSVYGICRFIAVENSVVISMMTKSATTAMAMELAEKYGGVPSLVASAVIVTGITSATLGTLAVKLLKLKDPVAVGVAYGVAGHVIGTAYATEIGETEGAIGSISFLLTGVLTSILFMVWPLPLV